MPEFTIHRHIEASIDTVWNILDDFGEIQRWNDGVKASFLTSRGPVGEGATRHCDFSPFGGVDERILRYEPNSRMTVEIHTTQKLPISSAIADFRLAPVGDGTELTIEYSYELNRVGRAVKGTTDRQLRSGIAGLADGLAAEGVRLESV